jgi:hypothetical protein
MRLWSPFRYKEQRASIAADGMIGNADQSIPSLAQRLNASLQGWIGVCYWLASLHLNPLDFYYSLHAIIQGYFPVRREKTTRRWFFLAIAGT